MGRLFFLPDSIDGGRASSPVSQFTLRFKRGYSSSVGLIGSPTML